MTESLLNNEPCFLNEPQWKAVLESLIVNDSFLSGRSETFLSLLILKSRIPHVFHHVTKFVSAQASYAPSQLERLISSARNLRTDLLQWRSDYQSLIYSAAILRVGTLPDEKSAEISAT